MTTPIEHMNLVSYELKRAIKKYPKKKSTNLKGWGEKERQNRDEAKRLAADALVRLRAIVREEKESKKEHEEKWTSFLDYALDLLKWEDSALRHACADLVLSTTGGKFNRGYTNPREGMIKALSELRNAMKIHKDLKEDLQKILDKDY